MDRLWNIRVKSFVYELLSMVGLSLAAFLTSDNFQRLIQTHFGETVVAGLALLLIQGAAKHLRNKSEVKKLGARSEGLELI